MNISFHGNYLLKVKPSAQDKIFYKQEAINRREARMYSDMPHEEAYVSPVDRDTVHIITNEDLKELKNAVQRIWEYSDRTVPPGDIRRKIAEAYRQRADKVDLTDIWK